MKAALSLLAYLVVVASQISPGLSMPSTAPAFLWSPHYHHQKAAINYQTISPKDLAKSVLSEGGWSNFLCPHNAVNHPLDLAIVFVGTELQSSDISGSKHADPALVDLLKVFFTQSNFSMAFPYIAASEKDAMESSLVLGMSDICGQKFGFSNVRFLESCSLEGENVQKLSDLHSVQDYIRSRMEKRSSSEADLVVFCHKGSDSSKELEHPHSESRIFSEIISSVDQSGLKYAVLYVSDPIKSIQYPSHRELERFLAESASGNASANLTACDEVCQIKSSLLEGLLVGTVCLMWGSDIASFCNGSGNCSAYNLNIRHLLYDGH